MLKGLVGIPKLRKTQRNKVSRVFFSEVQGRIFCFLLFYFFLRNFSKMSLIPKFQIIFAAGVYSGIYAA